MTYNKPKVIQTSKATNKIHESYAKLAQLTVLGCKQTLTLALSCLRMRLTINPQDEQLQSLNSWMAECNRKRG